jgi:pimeloyl-ACP methyl ester carboxylesterase
VFAFAYAQNVAVEKIPQASNLPGQLRLLKTKGYKEIVLIGHSAGALIARHLVEDYPDTGVTRVIQVCAPNAGSSWAGLRPVRSPQAEFIASLTRTYRERVLKQRADKSIPTTIQFVAVVGVTSHLGGDGIVSTRSQWSDDLQRQGVPVHVLTTMHREAMRLPRCHELLRQLVSEPQPRWSAEQVATTRRKLLES